MSRFYVEIFWQCQKNPQCNDFGYRKIVGRKCLSAWHGSDSSTKHTSWGPCCPKPAAVIFFWMKRVGNFGLRKKKNGPTELLLHITCAAKNNKTLGKLQDICCSTNWGTNFRKLQFKKKFIINSIDVRLKSHKIRLLSSCLLTNSNFLEKNTTFGENLLKNGIIRKFWTNQNVRKCQEVQITKFFSDKTKLLARKTRSWEEHLKYSQYTNKQNKKILEGCNFAFCTNGIFQKNPGCWIKEFSSMSELWEENKNDRKHSKF